jgi:thiol:disulfide interchange protein DsbD
VAAALPAWAKEDEPCTGPSYSDDHIKVELVAEDASFAPGSEPLVGLKLTIQEHWHVYWKNPGESGLPVEVKEWVLPEGWTAGPILWPTPARGETAGLVSYGYEGTALLPVRLKVPATASEGPATIKVKLEWLVCHEECVPGDAFLCIDVPVAAGQPKPGTDRALFEEARRLWPQPLPAGVLTVAAGADGKSVELKLKGAGPWADPKAELYAFIEEVIEGGKRQSAVDPSGAQTVRREGDVTTLRLPFPKKRTVMAAHMDGILSVTTEGKREGFVLSLDAPSLMDTGSGGGGPGDEERLPFWLLLLGAFVGGLILNIMPCVLPVLSIKILGFVGQADEDPVKVRRHGYAFALGVIASFWFLAGVLLLLRAGGEKLGWGFHLQEPAFVAALMAVMLVVGLNLMGLFEIGLSVMTLAATPPRRSTPRATRPRS